MLLAYLSLIATILTFVAILVLALVERHTHKNVLKLFEAHKLRMDQFHVRIASLERERRARRLSGEE